MLISHYEHLEAPSTLLNLLVLPTLALCYGKFQPRMQS